MWQQVHFALSQSAHRALFKLASFLPGLVALLVAVLVMTAVGALLAGTLRRILAATHFDQRIARNQTAAVADWSPAHSPTLLIARFVFWACVLIGGGIGISAFDASFSNNSPVSVFLLPYLTHAIGAVLLLVVGNLIARFLARSVLIGAVNARLQYARFLSLGVKWLVLVLTGAMVLDHLQVGGTVVELAFGILFGGIVLTLALAIGLGSRHIVSRSLERNVDLSTTDAPTTGDLNPPTTTGDPLRHF